MKSEIDVGDVNVMWRLRLAQAIGNFTDVRKKTK